MARRALNNDLNLVPRGYRINPDWNRNFREDQDKVTKVIDQILDMTVRECIGRENTTLYDVYFTKYWDWGNYCLVYKIKEHYDNLEVLFGAVLESTDDVLRWYDLTIMVNFNVYIITPYRTFRITYLDLLYEYVSMNHSRVSPDTINNHPRIQQMKEWVTRYQEYDRYTKKSTSYHDPYSYTVRGREQREYLGLRNDDRQVSPQEYRGIGILPGEYNDNMSVESHQQQIIERQRELYQNQISLRWSDYGVNNPCEGIELPNVTVTPRVTKSKLSKILNKLKW